MVDTSPNSDPVLRDATISINSYTTVVGRTAVPEERFRAYWRDVHGPVCSRVPGLGWYQQHHFTARRDSHLWPVPEGITPIPDHDLDGAVEIGFTGADAQGRFQEASSILFSDEQNVFEETVAYPMPTGTITVVERSRDPQPNGPDRLDRIHLHLSPAAGRRDDLLRHLLETLGALGAATEDVVTIRVHALDPHDNSTPNPPAPRVAHTVGKARVDLIVVEIAFTDSLARRRVFELPAFAAVNEPLTGLVQHLTAFPVVGVHTFVRAGALTDAGLRGSRVAELIGQLAAANQVGDDIRRLIRTGEI